MQWWRFEARRPALYGEIKKLRITESYPVITAVPRVSKHFNATTTTADKVFSDQIVVIVGEHYCTGILNTSIFKRWVSRYSSTFGIGLRFTPQDSFETFPFPSFSKVFVQAGINLEKRRRECLLSQEIGFTELVNQIHFLDSPQEELRNLIRQLDYAVLEAYSWNKDGPDGAAINLDHGFYTLPHLPRKDNIRFTISPVAWNQVWERLYALNQKRAKDEAIE